MRTAAINFIFIVLFVTPLFSQGYDNRQATEVNRESKDDEKAKKHKELKEKAYGLLSQTSDEIGMLRTAENRIGFTAELAALLWYYDESQARELYSNVFQDFRSLAGRFDNELNMYGERESSDGEMSILYAMTPGKDQAYFIALRKMQKVLMLRSSIAMTMVEHDPDLAHKFYYDGVSVITNKAVLDNAKHHDRQFEARFLLAVVAKDAAKAAELARRSLKDGVQSHHLNILWEMHRKDVEESIKYGADILSKLKSEGTSNEQGVWLVGQMLSNGDRIYKDSQNPGGKKPVYTQQQLREIANLLADIILAKSNDEYPSGSIYTDTIAEYSPSRAAQIKSRSAAANASLKAPESYESEMSDSYKQYIEQAEKDRKEAEAAANKRKEDLDALGNKDLPAEQRLRITNEARQMLLQEGDAATKIAGLGALAVVVSKSGDQELARQIMSDAATLVNPYPKTYVDYTVLMALAAAYAEIQPERSFMLLEGAMGKINQLIASFGTIAEFIDISEDMIIDNEFQVGAFGGGMLAGLTGQLGTAENSIGSLAVADYNRLVAIANRFERNEARVLAKMLIIRSLLDDGKETNTAGDITTATNSSDGRMTANETTNIIW